MEGICKVKERHGEKWVMFEETYDNYLTPEILDFILK